MQHIEAKQGQSFFDVVLVGSGNILNAVEMALKNNMSITSDVETGSFLSVSGVERKAVTRVFTHRYPATALTKESSSELTGLDYVLPGILPLSL